MSATETPMDAQMEALVYAAPRSMVMRSVPVPATASGDILVKVHYSGICGSELSGFLGQSSIRTPPLVFGHEVSGVVARVGEGLPEDSRIEVGSRVAVNPLVTCGACEHCLRGRQQLCGRRLLLGASLPGSNAAYVSVPASAVLPLPDRLSLASAAMVEPLAFAMHASEVGRIGPSSSALVVGAGTIGLFILQVLRASGVKVVYVAERNRERLAMAVAIGAVPVEEGDGGVSGWVRGRTDGRGVDTAFDAVGTEQTRRDCLGSVVAGGTVVLAGLHSDETRLPLNTVVRSEITLVGAFAYSPVQFRQALAWMADGRAGLTDGVVIAPLSDGQAWFERLVDGDPCAKVLLQPAGLAE